MFAKFSAIHRDSRNMMETTLSSLRRTMHAREICLHGFSDPASSFPLSRLPVLSQLYHEPAPLVTLPLSLVFFYLT